MVRHAGEVALRGTAVAKRNDVVGADGVRRKASHCSRQWCAPGVVAIAGAPFGRLQEGISRACSGPTRRIGKRRGPADDRIVM